MEVSDVYIRMHPTMDLNRLYSKLRESYENSFKVRYILDATVGNASPEVMKNIKNIFDKFKEEEEEKLLGTYIIVEGLIKKKIIQGFISIIGKKDKVKIIP